MERQRLAALHELHFFGANYTRAQQEAQNPGIKRKISVTIHFEELMEASSYTNLLKNGRM